MVDFWISAAVYCSFESGQEGRVERRQDAELAVDGRGVVGVELGAEVTEDGEGEGVAAAGVVDGEVGGARGEGGPGCHVGVGVKFLKRLSQR